MQELVKDHIGVRALYEHNKDIIYYERLGICGNYYISISPLLYKGGGFKNKWSSVDYFGDSSGFIDNCGGDWEYITYEGVWVIKGLQFSNDNGSLTDEYFCKTVKFETYNSDLNVDKICPVQVKK